MTNPFQQPKPVVAIECEQAVLGSILLKNDQYWPCVQAGLKADHFANDGHRALWRAIDETIKLGSPANPFTLAPRFRDRAILEGGHTYLAQLVATAPGIANVSDYAEVIIDCAVRRGLLDLSSQIHNASQDHETPTGEILALVEGSIDGYRDSGDRGGLAPMSDVMKETLEIAERAHQRGRVEGVESGLRAIDRVIGGLANTDLIVLAGRPGMGKSALAGTIAQHVAQSHTVALFSLEMAAAQFTSRMISSEAGVDSSRLRRGEISSDEMHRVIERGRAMENLRLLIDDQPQIRPGDMRARLKRLARTAPIGLIVVDYIQLMRGDTARRDGNKVLEVGEITGALKAMAKEFNCPMLALSQLNRAVELRDDKRPQLADLRDSGSIEQDADQVWFLYRDEYYARKEEPPVGATGDRYQKWEERLRAAAGLADLIVAKNRHGPDATLKLKFEGRFARFGNLE